MSETARIIEKLKNDRYSINDNKSPELLFTFNVDPEENLKKLIKITAIRSIDKGIKYFKIGLYLSAFEDKNAYPFFREAKKYFDKADNFEAEQFLTFINSEKIDINVYLKGSSHTDDNDSFESYRKERSLEVILEDFEIIRKEVLFNNYTSLKNILRIYNLVQKETISIFKANLKKYKIAFNIIENSKRKELIELKDSLKSKMRSEINKKSRRFMKDNAMEFFSRKDKINKSLITKKKNDVEKNYQSIMNVVESHKRSQENLSKLEKMKLIKTIEKHNNELISIGELDKQYDIIENIEKNNYENELAAYEKELETKYEKKHETLKDENKALLNFRRIFFESIRQNQFGTLFGKDYVKIFSAKEDNYSSTLLWTFYTRIKICEQDYKDFEGIRNAFDSMRKKLIRIDAKTKRMFESPDEIFKEIENIQNNVN